MKKLAILEGRSELLVEKPYNSIGIEEAIAAEKVVRSESLSGFVGRAGGAFLGGKYVKQLEEDFKKYFKVPYAVSFNSATTALQAAVGALGIGPGDEVITSSYTMAASASAILLNNAIPVFADVDENSSCLDPASVRSRIMPRTKAILAVNIFGGSAEYDELLKIAKEYNLKIIEDNAQAPGGMYRGEFTGTIGDIGVFSLNVHKAIQCGEGGVLVTKDPSLAYRAQLIRNHGEVVVDDLAQDEPLMGSNYRLSEVQAAIAIEQFKKLDGFNDYRREMTSYLSDCLKEIPWLIPCQVKDHIKHVYYIYPFRYVEEKLGLKRSTVVKAMLAEGFRLGQGYQKPLYLLSVFQNKRIYPRTQFPFVSSEFPTEVSYAKGICPTTERLYEKEMLYTTSFQPPNGKAEINGLVDALKRIEEQAEDLHAYEAQN